jgi:hypothetical protein
VETLGGWALDSSAVTFNIVYEEPDLLVKGLDAIREGLQRAGCNMTVGPSWIVASCKSTFIKVMASLSDTMTNIVRPRNMIVVTAEGEPNDLVTVSGLILGIGKSTGGGVLLSQG